MVLFCHIGIKPLCNKHESFRLLNGQTHSVERMRKTDMFFSNAKAIEQITDYKIHSVRKRFFIVSVGK